jgi:hypothetical protein
MGDSKDMSREYTMKLRHLQHKIRSVEVLLLK